jgi:hypothetical protein
MARGGQLFAPAPQPTNWLGLIFKIGLAIVVVYMIYLAFFKTCNTSGKKEKFGGECPCKNKRGNGMFLL